MAPLGSFTKPEIDPKSDCANARLVQSSKTNASAKARNEHTRFIVSSLNQVKFSPLAGCSVVVSRVPPPSDRSCNALAEGIALGFTYPKLPRSALHQIFLLEQCFHQI
jgi:hypothetical protein